MKKEITIDDLPLGVQRQMRDSIRKDSAFMELSGAWAELIKTGQFARSAILKKKMDQIEDETLRLYIKEYVVETSEPMINLLKEMNVDDVEQWNVNVNALILLCDMIETLVSECNQTLHKYHPDFRLEMFDRLGDLGEEVHQQVKFMSNCTTMMYQTNFGDASDDIYELVMNKCRAFSRRMIRLNKEKAERESKEAV